ncbi:MAG TPA: hypothetical protein VNQ90_19580 [Chthoniobacteraceae bacterium]|nr:hypothetical protein [Chthoniobacteraceae bacterium]
MHSFWLFQFFEGVGEMLKNDAIAQKNFNSFEFFSSYFSSSGDILVPNLFFSPFICRGSVIAPEPFSPGFPPRPETFRRHPAAIPAPESKGAIQTRSTDRPRSSRQPFAFS